MIKKDTMKSQCFFHSILNKVYVFYQQKKTVTTRNLNHADRIQTHNGNYGLQLYERKMKNK